MISPEILSENPLENQIISYLKSKGRLQGVLLFKLEKRFCSRDSKYRVKKIELKKCLFKMMKARVIEIIITEPFDIRWKEHNFNNFKYLKDDIYFKRFFTEINGFNSQILRGNKSFFDSRRIDFNDQVLVKREIEVINNILKRAPLAKYKTIIFYPTESVPLNIYEPFEGDFDRDFIRFSAPSELIEEGFNFEVPFEQQKLDLTVIKSYRSNYMCFYITLIESIQKNIQDLQEKYQNGNEKFEKLQDLITKFGYYCEMYVRSDWVDIQEGNPYRWETFFNYYDLPFKILNLEFKSINFHGRTFDCWIKYRYCVFIDKNKKEIINKLLGEGYQEFEDASNREKTAIGLDLEIFIPCPAIEYFYFVFKYICYYNIFMLFFNSFSYTKNLYKSSDRDKYLYKIIDPVYKSLFNVNPEKNASKVVFKYYTLNPDELEILYNTLMVNKIRKVEKSLFNYFLLRTIKK